MKYSKIPLQGFNIWKKVNRDLSYYSKIIYMYLFSSSLTSMSGIFELPDLRKTGLSENEINDGLLELSNRHLIVLDDDNEMVAIYEMIKINKPAGEKQEKGIIKNYKDIEDFSKWNQVLDYMIEIDYNNTIIEFIKTDKLNKSNGFSTTKISNKKDVFNMTQEEKDEEIKEVEKKLAQKRINKPQGQEEVNQPILNQNTIDYKMKSSKEILDLYIEKSKRMLNGSIERESLELIYNLLNEYSQTFIENAINRYISTLQDIKYTQGIIKFFSKKDGYLQGFLKDPKKGINKTKNVINGSYTEYKNVVEKKYNLPDNINAIDSLAIKEIYSRSLNVQFMDFIRIRTEWVFLDEEFIKILSSRLIASDNLAIKFLAMNGISI